MPSSRMRKQKREYLNVSRSGTRRSNSKNSCGVLPNCDVTAEVFPYRHWCFNPVGIDVPAFCPQHGFFVPGGSPMFLGPPYPVVSASNGVTLGEVYTWDLTPGVWFAPEGAEKSCKTKRRLRGLRKGVRRSRGRHPRRTETQPANVAKPLSARKVNHIGRKFIWAVKASNRFRKVCQRYLKVSVDSRRPGYRKSLTVWWQHLADRAKLAGIPSQAAFHDSWWKYMGVEVHTRADAGWDMILTGLPRRGESPSPERGEPAGKRPERGIASLFDDVGNTLRTESEAPCKKCRGLGSQPGFGYPNGCSKCYPGHPRYRKPGRASNVSRGGRLRRP